MLPPVLPPITPAPLVRPRVGFSRRATRHFVKGGNREKHFCCPLLTIFRGGGQEKCLLYSNNKKKNLTNSRYSVSSDQDEIKKKKSILVNI